MKKLTTSAWVVALFIVLPSFSISPAFAQQSTGTGSSSGAPIFSIANFQGDARSADLYYYMHQQTFPQWDVYRRRLQEAARRIVDQQPTQQSPSPENLAGNGTQSMANINSVAQSASQAVASASSHSSASSTGSSTTSSTASSTAPSSGQTSVSTSVQGTVLTPNVSVPGLLDP